MTYFKILLFCLAIVLTTPCYTTEAQNNNTKVLINEANRHAKAGHYTQALSALSRVIAKDPKNARAYKLRGHVYYAKGMYERAFTDLDHVVALVSDSANAYVDRAIVHSVLGRHGLALADVEKALALKPSSAFAKAVREKVLERASQKS